MFASLAVMFEDELERAHDKTFAEACLGALSNSLNFLHFLKLMWAVLMPFQIVTTVALTFVTEDSEKGSLHLFLTFTLLLTKRKPPARDKASISVIQSNLYVLFEVVIRKDFYTARAKSVKICDIQKTSSTAWRKLKIAAQLNSVSGHYLPI